MVVLFEGLFTFYIKNYYYDYVKQSLQNQADYTNLYYNPSINVETSSFEKKVNNIIKNKDGSFTITTSLPENEWLIRYILSFGADIEVLAPQNIRNRLQKEIEKINMIYAKIT